MTKSNFAGPLGGRPEDRRHEGAGTCGPIRRGWRPFLGVTAVVVAVAAACFASGCAGAAREGGSADVPVDHRGANLPGSESVTNASTAAESNSLDAETVWQTDYQQALTLAAEEGRPVLLRFTAGWCMPCQVMERKVFPDEEVKAALAAHSVPVVIDVDEEANADIVQRYGIRGIPTLLLVDADGKELDRGGFMSAEALVEFVRRS